MPAETPSAGHDLPAAKLLTARARVDDRLLALATRKHVLERRRRTLGIATLVAAALLASTTGWISSHTAPAWPVGASAALTLILVVLWQQLLRPLTRIERLQTLYREIVDRMEERGPTTARGIEFRRASHTFEHDLGILGEHSLFAHLPPARTEAGAAALASLLLDPTDAAAVLDRQQTVQALAPALDLRERIALLGPGHRHSISADAIATWARTPVLALPRAASVALAFISAAVCLLLLIGLLHSLTSPLVLRNLAVLAAVQAAITYQLRARVVSSLTAAERLAPEVTLLREAVALLALTGTTATTPLLDRLRAEVLQPDGAAKPLAQLDSRLSLVHERHQQWFILVSLLFSAGTQSAIALERWRAQHGPALLRWLSAWSQFDALNALAAYAFEHPDYTYPAVQTAGSARFEATDLCHPLLPRALAVGNTITLNDSTRFLLISGSNMSGKSTLLRSVGCAVVLSYAGAPVPCSAARLSMLRLCASITPADSLSKGRSRFLAELEQLRAMLRPDTTSPGHTPPPTLFLIDEILGGTNSADRHAAAGSILRRLIAEDAIGALSTHDLSLVPLADDPALHGRNAHMSSPDAADPLRFDFTLRPGVNRISSAPALLRLLGL